ncbi:MAG: pyridoxal phosphate-dependent class II aminotransferase [Clostridiales bacterium]|nr:pyridoxal phosphate-dependent class II aminotransferase [Clostridiales bacterium]
MRHCEHGGDIYEGAPVALDFSVNTNPLGMPPQVTDILRQKVSSFACYPDPRCRQLGAALSHQLGMAENQILWGAGAADLLFRICACFRPRVVLTLAPTFSEYGRPVELFGGTVREHRLTASNGFLPTDSLLADITPAVDIFFLCNPNNPTGRLCPPGLVQKILRRCRETGTLLVVDECFLPFTAGQSVLDQLKDFPRLLILRAFTKLYAMAGLRLGYLLGEPSLLEQIGAYGSEWAVSVPAQLSGVAALMAEPGWSEQARQFVAAERRRISVGLIEQGFSVYPGEANFLLFKSPCPLVEPLRKRGILVRSCRSFTGLDDTFIRIGIKTREKNDVLLRTIEEVRHG